MALGPGVDLHGNMKRKVPDRVVLAEGWSLTWGLRCTVSLKFDSWHWQAEKQWLFLFVFRYCSGVVGKFSSVLFFLVR